MSVGLEGDAKRQKGAIGHISLCALGYQDL